MGWTERDNTMSTLKNLVISLLLRLLPKFFERILTEIGKNETQKNPDEKK